jgi:ABC-type dipeptide/oligopeptide/nickel transport system permease subunit
MVWRRFSHHRLALASGIVLVVLLLLSFVGQLISLPVEPLHSGIAIVAPKPLGPTLQPFNPSRLLGTDVQEPGLGIYFGVPIATYMLQGGLPILEIGILGALLATLIGSLVGGVAGYLGGVIDAFLMRVLDAIFTVPFLPLLLVLSPRLPDRSPLEYVLLLGLTGWPGIARLGRGAILSLREREFALAAKALGGSDMRVVLRHMLPNALDVLIVACTLNIAAFILATANLTFLGTGPLASSPPLPHLSAAAQQVGSFLPVTWATPLTEGGDVLGVYWWMLFFPLIPLFLAVLSVNFLGDGLRDALDVTSQQDLLRARAPREHRAVLLLSHRLASASEVLSKPLAAVRSALTAGSRAVTWRAMGLPGVRRLQRTFKDQEQVHPAEVHRAARITATALLPVVLLLAGMGCFLYAHSPLLYSSHYNSAQMLDTAAGASEYGAVAMPDGGWSLLFTAPDDRVVYLRTLAAGNQLRRLVVGQANATSLGRPSLAVEGRSALGAWVSPGGGIRVARIGPRSVDEFSLPVVGSSVDHPYVIGVASGRFEVLFQALDSNGVSSIYLAGIPPAGGRATFVREIVRSHDYALDPRGVADGSGNLDVIYMSRFHAPFWHWMFRRFAPSGMSLRRPQVLETVSYYIPGPPPVPTLLPDRWAAEIERASDGTVWAAWGGDGDASVAHWSRAGKILLPPTVVIPFGWEQPTATHFTERALGLSVNPRGGVIFHEQGSFSLAYIAATPFDLQGTATASSERIVYLAGGYGEDPHGGLVHGRPAVIWLRVGGSTAAIMLSQFHPAQSPDLLTRFGLNIGTLWQNILFVILGSLAVGAGAALVNLLIPAALVGIWLLLSRMFRGRLLWSVYFLVICGALLYLFARADQPGYVQVISGLGSPVNWIAVIGGMLFSWWTGFLALRQQDAVIRASGIALACIYFVGVMWAVVWVQSQMTVI